MTDSEGILKPNATYTYQDYLREFTGYCHLVGVPPSLSLLKKCILIAVADICASNPPNPLVGTTPETESAFLNLIILLIMKPILNIGKTPTKSIIQQELHLGFVMG